MQPQSVEFGPGKQSNSTTSSCSYNRNPKCPVVGCSGHRGLDYLRILYSVCQVCHGLPSEEDFRKGFREKLETLKVYIFVLIDTTHYHKFSILLKSQGIEKAP